MTRIGLISDTHGFLDEAVFKHFEACDEIWHAGDFGVVSIAEALANFKTFKGVFGNIDGYDVRSIYPQKLIWKCEEVTVFMTHIGGYPNKYAPGIKAEIVNAGARLFICGHSHILKVIYDPKINCLHMNPGAAGKQGWHQVRTLIRFSIDEKEIKDCEVIELGKR
ncbi:MAG TPA: metallophosphoesterase family protein [Chitinophagaceae bacterium]|nr:metallophosphoesterase family protein [Chitinophagaceae bacterium]